jgi:hypothetical protein
VGPAAVLTGAPRAPMTSLDLPARSTARPAARHAARHAAAAGAPRELTRWAADALAEVSDKAIAALNARLSLRITVGGRRGSGMGSLLENEWGHEVGRRLRDQAAALASPVALELAWMCDNGYNDFALIDDTSGAAQNWTPSNREGEVLRVEVKSMALDATESKAHFDALFDEIGPSDLLVVLLWRWEPVPERPGRVRPVVSAAWMGSARAIAELRDALHRARGGSFVTAEHCPDRCGTGCVHVGEPLNAHGTRERLSGPSATVTGSVTHAANFGGLVRMLKVRTAVLVELVDACRAGDARSFVDFIHTHFPEEETRAFPLPVWAAAARLLGHPRSTDQATVRGLDGYRDALFLAARLKGGPPAG